MPMSRHIQYIFFALMVWNWKYWSSQTLGHVSHSGIQNIHTINSSVCIFKLGIDRYVFFRADTDTDYYRSSRPITDILNRYTCLV